MVGLSKAGLSAGPLALAASGQPPSIRARRYERSGPVSRIFVTRLLRSMQSSTSAPRPRQE